MGMLDGATDQLAILLKKDQLPGMRSTDRYQLESLPIQNDSTNYPQRVTFQIEKTNAPNWILVYRLQRDHQDSPWLLVQAWKQNKTNSDRVELFDARQK